MLLDPKDESSILVQNVAKYYHPTLHSFKFPVHLQLP
jgi:hypothetical protein